MAPGRESGRAVEADGVVRHVLVQVRQHQQQVQHALPLAGIGLADFFIQIADDGERIGEKPFEVAGTELAAFAAAIQRIVRAGERVVEKMIEAKLLGRESIRNRTRARGPSAACW